MGIILLEIIVIKVNISPFRLDTLKTKMLIYPLDNAISVGIYGFLQN